MTLNLRYDSEADTVQKLLEEICTYLAAHDKVETDSVIVYLINFGSTSLEVSVRCYIQGEDWKAFTADKEIILLEILRMVERLGLHIAFPRSALDIGAVRGGEANLSEQPLGSAPDMHTR